jgi:hypothetical protein
LGDKKILGKAKRRKKTEAEKNGVKAEKNGVNVQFSNSRRRAWYANR